MYSPKPPLEIAAQEGPSDRPPTVGPLGERLTPAEMLPIRVHFDRDTWLVDYGSYMQGRHTNRQEAVATAAAAAIREKRALTVEYGYTDWPTDWKT